MIHRGQFTLLNFISDLTVFDNFHFSTSEGIYKAFEIFGAQHITVHISAQLYEIRHYRQGFTDTVVIFPTQISVM